MPSVLISTDTVKCPHSPGAATNVSAPKLKVNGAPVLIDLKPVTGCPITTPPATNVACKIVTITSGTASKLKVNGSAVLLSSLVATAAGSPGGPMSVTPGQTKLLTI